MNQWMAWLKAYFLPGLQRRRMLMAVLGVLVCGVGVACCRVAGFGVDSFQSLCSGLYNVIPLPQGTVYILINAVLLAVDLLLDRHYIGLGTLINLFLLGYVIDGSEVLLRAVFGTPTLAGQIAFLAVGFLVCCASCSVYITADLGVSTYDAISLYVARETPIPYRVIRIITDVICVAVGWLLGSVPGVCTLLCAFCMGPMISLLNRVISEPMLYGRGGRGAAADKDEGGQGHEKE